MATSRRPATLPIKWTSETARTWLRRHRSGGRSVGLLASSGAVRLVGDGIPPAPRSNELPIIGHWFLKPFTDFRSAGSLEMPMSEFGCQGLELDFVGLCWGGDLVWREGAWMPRMMRAPRSQIIREEQKRRFRLNAYRALLTRARAGVVIFVPPGREDDPTRSPVEVDGVFEALTLAGCRWTGRAVGSFQGDWHKSAPQCPVRYRRTCIWPLPSHLAALADSKQSSSS
jgi:hypothetical protein